MSENLKSDEILSPANFNSIGQTVIAGHSAAVDRAIALAQTKGAKMAKRLPVSVPSHCCADANGCGTISRRIYRKLPFVPHKSQ